MVRLTNPYQPTVDMIRTEHTDTWYIKAYQHVIHGSIPMYHPYRAIHCGTANLR